MLLPILEKEFLLVAFTTLKMHICNVSTSGFELVTIEPEAVAQTVLCQEEFVKYLDYNILICVYITQFLILFYDIMDFTN